MDMFFVLSGFLIGSIVLTQAQAGKLRLRDFWAARVRRLFPALAAMIIVMGSLAWWVSPIEKWPMWRDQISWACWYAENIHLIIIDANYFDGGRDSPFIHLWSLAVEEQFYLVLPLLVLLAAVVAKSLRRWSVRMVVGVSSGMLLVSAMAFFQLSYDRSHPAISYYDPRGHSFGLLAGVLLACCYPSVRSFLESPGRARPWLQGLGIAAVVGILTVTVMGENSAFYVRIGAPVTAVGTVLLICVSRSEGPARSLLSLKPLAFIGAISYGIYLWAVGISVLIGKPIVDGGILPVWAVWAGVAAASIAIATASWKYLEMPVRGSRRLKKYPLSTIFVALVGMALLGVAFQMLPPSLGSLSG